MNFKNHLEEQVFNIAKRICGDGVVIEHNKILEIERAILPETASFSGPPKKEIDVITARLNCKPEITLLISCKQFDGGKAEPAHIQEWAAVVHTMNKYSQEVKYLGLVVSRTGFTRGCEPWATSSNIGLIPPLKGVQVVFSPDIVLQMFNRAIGALVKRLAFPSPALLSAPGFYDFVFRLTADYEGHEEVIVRGVRYALTGTGWPSSFGELVAMVRDKKITEVLSTTEFVGVRLAGDVVFKFAGNKVLFGPVDSSESGQPNTPICKKNISSDDCSFDFVKQLVVGRAIASAGDFGTHFEFGLDNEINLGFRPGAFHVVCTRNPIEKDAL